MQATEQGNASVLVELFRHNIWANLKLLDFCEGLSDEQLDSTATGTYGSIRDTLHHLVGAEVSYVYRVNGKFPETVDFRHAFPGFDVLKEAARWSSDELLQLALSAHADTLVTESEPGASCAYNITALIVQVINHATEHRTQISTIVTQLGLQPPDMDGWTYMVETGIFKEWKTDEATS